MRSLAFIFLALTANFIVEMVYCLSHFYKEHVTIIEVRHSPYKEFLKILVNLESLKGTCYAPVVSEWITLPKQDKDKFIFLASYKVSPVAPLLDIFYEPAKSIKDSFDLFPFFLTRLMKTTVWLREE
jgi:hypothetical protein